MNMGTFMRKEALIYMTEMNRTGKESVMKGKRTNLQTTDGFVQIRTSSDFYLDPRDQQNIHFHHSSTLTKRDEEHTVTTDIPAGVIYKTKPEPLPAPLIFNYTVLTEDFMSDKTLPPELESHSQRSEFEELRVRIARGLPLPQKDQIFVAFQYFSRQPHNRPSWHVVSNLARIQRQIHNIEPLEYEIIQDPQAQEYLNERYLALAGPALPFIRWNKSQLEFNGDFLLTEGALKFHENTTFPSEVDHNLTFAHSFLAHRDNNPFSEN
jgi:hypothetical protein